MQQHDGLAAWQARRFSEAFQEQFLACNQALHKHRGINCSLSGSTGVVAFLQAGLLYCTAAPVPLIASECSLVLRAYSWRDWSSQALQWAGSL